MSVKCDLAVIRCGAVSSGVELLASGSKDCEVRLWDPLTSACLAVVAGHVAAVTAVAWAQSKAKAGKLLATGGADKLLKLWDTTKLLAAVSAAAGEAAAGEEAGGATTAATTCGLGDRLQQCRCI